MSESTVLLIDDDENILTVLEMRLRAGGYRVLTARDGDEAMGRLDRDVDVVVSDLRLAHEDGLDVMERVLAADPTLPVLILTAHGSISGAVEAMKRGARGYLTKPVDRDELFAQLQRAVESRRLRAEVHALRRAVAQRAELHGVIGASAGMLQVFELIERFAPTTMTVAIHGESGTGKELVARAVHRSSDRANRRFLAINCAAVAEGLLQSELFGHVKGSFTGATQSRVGLFQQADGGTLLLDEIGDMSPALQASLLRVLQEREILPVGGRAPIPVDVRVLVATHRDLKQLVRDGTFREDLYYRVDVAPIHLPPLRERGDDIDLLADRFLALFSERGGRRLRFSAQARAAMRAYSWPGNVRELLHAVERSTVMAQDELVEARDLFLQGGAPPPTVAPVGSGSPLPHKQARDAWEAEYLRRLLRHTGGNISQAARVAGKYRADLYALLKKHGIDPGDFKS